MMFDLVVLLDDEPLASIRLERMIESYFNSNKTPVPHIVKVQSAVELYQLLEENEKSSPEQEQEQQKAKQEIVRAMSNATTEPHLGKAIETQCEQFAKVLWRKVLVFLDLNMPNENGLEVANKIEELKKNGQHEKLLVSFVFATAYNDKALEAFEANAVDYILKPVRQERLELALQKASERLEWMLWSKLDQAFAQNMQEQSEESPALTNSKEQFIRVQDRLKVQFVPITDILFFKSEMKYCTIRTEKKEYVSEHSLINLEEKYKEDFIRIHRNCLVSKSQILGFERECGEGYQWAVKLRGYPELLPISRRQWSVLRAWGKDTGMRLDD